MSKKQVVVGIFLNGSYGKPAFAFPPDFDHKDFRKVSDIPGGFHKALAIHSRLFCREEGMPVPSSLLDACKMKAKLDHFSASLEAAGTPQIPPQDDSESFVDLLGGLQNRLQSLASASKVSVVVYTAIELKGGGWNAL